MCSVEDSLVLCVSKMTRLLNKNNDTPAAVRLAGIRL